MERGRPKRVPTVKIDNEEDGMRRERVVTAVVVAAAILLIPFSVQAQSAEGVAVHGHWRIDVLDPDVAPGGAHPETWFYKE